MSTNVSQPAPAHRQRVPRFLLPALAVLAVAAVAIVLALAIDGSGSGSTAPGQANGVPPGSGVSLGRQPEVQLRYYMHGSALAGSPVGP
ncbi:MAG TPA: hypothetical protein VES62_08135 [Thermoleophilaceae bacterium]|nr:hypothetical protein [Actinomycetota bacterium]HYN50881.1 hypothetical protein [Thermoleophilaceae bacterium]